MAVFISGVSLSIFQGVEQRDSDDAFMEYIGEQVETFTLGVSYYKMLLIHYFY